MVLLIYRSMDWGGDREGEGGYDRGLLLVSIAVSTHKLID